MCVSLMTNTPSLIDDVMIDDDEDKGHPILFNNQEIRRMFHLAQAGPTDVFYDLGSGWGQNLIIALTEFHVKKVVGIEKDRERYHVCTERLQKRGIAPSRGQVVREDFERVLAGRVKGVDPAEATFVFYGLSTYKVLLDKIQRRLKRGSRLIYYYNCLFPEILPDRVLFPFFMSILPFRRPRSRYEWLSSVVRKRRSSIVRGKRPGLQELWDELSHDYDVKGVAERIGDYEKRLEKTVG